MEKGTLFFKKVKLILLFTIACFALNTQAAKGGEQEVITFTWKGDTSVKELKIRATQGKAFTIDWGNETSKEYTGAGNTDVTCTQETAYDNTTSEYEVTVTAGEGCVFTYLSVSSKQVVSLDVSRAPSLTTLYCGSNSLTSLDVSKNTALTSLSCYSNSLTTLDVSNNTALTRLECFSNPLTSLDVSANTKLDHLWCENNKLTNLDVSKNTALTTLYCGNNKLTSLDVSKNTALTILYCDMNPLLDTLDVSKNTALTRLACYSTSLTSLDVSNNTALTELWCYNSSLTSLKINSSTAASFIYLECYGNKIPLADLKVLPSKAKIGVQTLPEQTVSLNTPITVDDAFHGEGTNFVIKLNGSAALENTDYTISDGDVTFKSTGTFGVTMTNAQLGSADKPAEIKMTFNVVKSTDATLKTLTLSQGTLSPTFNASTLTYTANVPYSTASITINATANDTNATLSGTGTGCGAKNLNVGENEFEIVVTAEDGSTTKTYKVTVIREQPSANAPLTVSHGTLVPEFDPDVTDYTVNVDNSTATISFSTMFPGATVTITKIKTPDNTLKQAPVNTLRNALRNTSSDAMTLDVGVNLFEIEVRGTTTRIYRITVIREAAFGLSSDNQLSALWLSGSAMLTPEFNSNVKNYTVAVGAETEEIEVNATPSYFKSTVGGTGVKRLIHGENTFDITVIAEDGTRAIYTLTITRGGNTVSLEKISSDAIQIYPNPVTDYFRVEGITEPATVSVYSLQGSVLLQCKAEPDEHIYVGNLAKGIYLVRVNGMIFKVLKR